MNFTATMSPVLLSFMSLATPKLPLPMSRTCGRAGIEGRHHTRPRSVSPPNKQGQWVTNSNLSRFMSMAANRSPPRAWDQYKVRDVWEWEAMVV